MNQDIYKDEYKELDIKEYIRVIKKRKLLIFYFFIFGIIIGLSVFFVLPPKYTAQTILEVGMIGSKLIDNPVQVAEKIQNGFYGGAPGLKAKNLINTNLVQIEIISEYPEEAKKILNEVKTAVLIDHNNKIESGRELIRAKIDKRVALLEDTIKGLEEDISFLMVRGQQVAELRKTTYNYQLEINDLKGQEYNYQPTKVIKEPTVSKGKLNLFLKLFIGGILGIFIGIFLTFGKEWWDKNK